VDYSQFALSKPGTRKRKKNRTRSKATKEKRELVKRADYLCKILAERRDGGVSAKSGLPAAENNPLQACHILAKGHHHLLRWTLDNIVTLRYSEHRYWAHTDPVSFVDWVEAKYPGRLGKLRIAERMTRKVDLKELLIVLESEVGGAEEGRGKHGAVSSNAGCKVIAESASKSAEAGHRGHG